MENFRGKFSRDDPRWASLFALSACHSACGKESSRETAVNKRKILSPPSRREWRRPELRQDRGKGGGSGHSAASLIF